MYDPSLSTVNISLNTLSSKFLGISVPVRIRLLLAKYEIYVIASPKHISTVFKNGKYLSWTATSIIGAANMFALPKRDIALYIADDSGVSHTPHPQSNVDPKYRVWYLVHKSVAEFLSGPGLAPLVERYMYNLRAQVITSEIGDQWTYQSNLSSFVQNEVFRASINATFGPHMLSLSPTFIEDFWKWDKCVPPLLKGLPRWLAPGSWRARDKCLESVRKWHEFADENDGKYEIDENEQADPIFGSKFMRVRYRYFTAMDRMSKDHRISANLGFIWA